MAAMSNSHAKLAAAAVIVTFVVVMGRLVDLREALAGMFDRIAEMGPAGMGAFVAIYVAACVFLLPASVLSLGAGAIYGVAAGTALVSLSATLGASASFLVGRYLARDWIAGRIEGNRVFKAIDESIAAEGWKIVALARLSPAIPFNLLNYGLGITRIAFGQYVLVSWAFMLPGTVLYVYIGGIAGDLAQAGDASRQRGPLEWIMLGAGLLATLAVTAMLARIARNALRQRIGRG